MTTHPHLEGLTDNALWSAGGPHVRMLLGMKHGPTVHAKACDDPEFKARSDAAIDASIQALAALPGGGVDEARSAFARLTDDQRMEVMLDYCRHCGCTDPRCQCWNDE